MNDGCGHFAWVNDAPSTSVVHDEGIECKFSKGWEVERVEFCKAREVDRAMAKAEITFLRCLLCIVYGLHCWDHMQRSA